VHELAGQLALTRRESEVLALLAAGHSNRQIADDLVISPATVARHVHSILAKVGVANRTSAAAWVLGQPQKIDHSV
jgi:DNA-binding NarL/FixJ family response regulator